MTTAAPAAPTLHQVRALNARLLGHRADYYVRAAPTITDAEYDALEDQLRTLVGEDERLQRVATVLSSVGSDLVGNLGAVRHRIPMLSLEKATTAEEVSRWLATVPSDATFTIEPKVDGLSLSVRYFDWRLSLALTRGDGESGEDVTAAAMTIHNIPKSIPTCHPHDLEVRFEVFMLSSVFDSLNRERIAAGKEPFANPRNAASGSLKLKDYKEVANRCLSAQPWQVIGHEPKAGVVRDGNQPGVSLDDLVRSPSGLEHSQALELFAAKNRCTRQPQVSRIYRREDLLEAIERHRAVRDELWSNGLGMLTDGIVIKVEEHQIRQQMGASGRTPNWAIAFKYPAEQAVTTLLGVTWQVGRTGKVTPVAELEPVSVSGSTVARATINNITYLREKLGNPRIGDKVLLHKGGEVIPNILGVQERGSSTEDIQAPTHCPDCGQTLLTDRGAADTGVDQIYCVNDYCPSRVIGHFTHLAKREILDVTGLGDALADQLVRMQVTPTLGNLWVFGAEAEQTPTDELEAMCTEAGFGLASIVMLVEGLKKARTASWDRWLQALNIPGLGKEGAKAVAAHLQLGDEDMRLLADKLLMVVPGSVEGFGPERCKELQAWSVREDIRADLQLLYDAGVRPTGTVSLVSGSAPLAGYTICITGEFGEDRDSLSRKLESLGAVMKSGVSKKINLLLTGSGSGKNKLSKAAELGVRTEGKEWLVQALASGGLSIADNGFGADDDMEDL